MALNKTDLDVMAARGCQIPNCTHGEEDGPHNVVFHARCHVQACPKVTYRQGSGLLELHCAVCDKFITAIKVAD
jgi:hypothetical protein